LLSDRRKAAADPHALRHKLCAVALRRIEKSAFRNVDASPRCPILDRIDRHRRKADACIELGALGCAMQDIIRQKNLEHFRSLLRKTSHREERMLLLMMLAEEQMKEPRPQEPANDN
jgi:hypothetical protein